MSARLRGVWFAQTTVLVLALAAMLCGSFVPSREALLCAIGLQALALILQMVLVEVPSNLEALAAGLEGFRTPAPDKAPVTLSVDAIFTEVRAVQVAVVSLFEAFRRSKLSMSDGSVVMGVPESGPWKIDAAPDVSQWTLTSPTAHDMQCECATSTPSSRADMRADMRSASPASSDTINCVIEEDVHGSRVAKWQAEGQSDRDAKSSWCGGLSNNGSQHESRHVTTSMNSSYSALMRSTASVNSRLAELSKRRVSQSPMVLQDIQQARGKGSVNQNPLSARHSCASPVSSVARRVVAHPNPSTRESSARDTETTTMPWAPHMPLAGEGMPKSGINRKRGTVLSMALDIMELCEYDATETLGICEYFVYVALESVRSEQGVPFFVGADTIRCAWNALVPCPRHEVAAYRAARALRVAVMTEQEFSSRRSERVLSVQEDAEDDEESPFNAVPTETKPNLWSIAAATGSVFAGQIGSDRHILPFVFGRPVEQAIHLNRLATHLNVPILVTDIVRSGLYGQDVVVRPVDVVNWSHLGRCEREKEVVYELMLESTKFDTDKWSRAFHNFLSGEYDEAVRLFSASTHSDTQTMRIVQLCRGHAELPAPFQRRLDLWQRFPTETAVQRLSTSTANDEALVTGSPPTMLHELSNRRTIAKKQEEQVHDQLRIAIDNHMKRTSNSAEASGSDSDCSDDDELLPVEFCDASGQSWKRSSQRIGRGASGDVWLGISNEGSFVALKYLKLPRQQSAANPRQRQSDVNAIVNEVEMLTQHRHECIVSFIGYGIFEGLVIITMEYVAGGSLAGVLEQFGALTVPTAKRYLRAILAGLHYLHGNEIIHCDMKPANILLTTEGSCRLSDFGTSTRLSAVQGWRVPQGTLLFMSPEACRGELCKAADVWALGLVLIQMLMNATPFSWDAELAGMNGARFSRWLCTEDGGVPLPDLASVDADAHALVERILKRDPRERPATHRLLYEVFVVA